MAVVKLKIIHVQAYSSGQLSARSSNDQHPILKRFFNFEFMVHSCRLLRLCSIYISDMEPQPGYFDSSYWKQLAVGAYGALENYSINEECWIKFVCLFKSNKIIILNSSWAILIVVLSQTADEMYITTLKLQVKTKHNILDIKV